MTKYLITGSSGFIGSHLVEEINRQNYETYTVDIVDGQDLCDMEYVRSLPDVDVIFHLAAVNGTWKFYDNPWEVSKNNTLPTLNLLERYRSTNAKFVFASTCEIFNGAIDQGVYTVPTDEQVPVMFNDIRNPRWSYSLPKALGENLVANSGLPYLILRYFNIYGPKQTDHFISEFYNRISDHGNPTIIGNDTRSFCYVKDAARLTVEVSKKASNEILNIGREDEIKIADVAQTIMELRGFQANNLEIKISPKGSVSRRCPDMTKTMKYLNGFKYTELKDGLMLTLDSYDAEKQK